MLSYANGPGFHRLAVKGEANDWSAIHRVNQNNLQRRTGEDVNASEINFSKEEALKVGIPAPIDHIYPSAVPLQRLDLFYFLPNILKLLSGGK